VTFSLWAHFGLTLGLPCVLFVRARLDKIAYRRAALAARIKREIFMARYKNFLFFLAYNYTILLSNITALPQLYAIFIIIVSLIIIKQILSKD